MPEFTDVAPTLPASDYARARQFYEGVLGFTVEREFPGETGVMYHAGPAHVFLYPSEFAGTNQATSATLLVADIAAAVEELRAKGVTFEEYDFPGLKTVDGIAELEGEKSAWFKDTEGNIIGLGELTG
jgi:catechol 2,3-dioxygenase-like lactoylglutathione lyase family enzyme